MFLTQDYLNTAISLNDNPAMEIGSEDVVWQNTALFKEIENVLEDYPEYPYQAAFSIRELRQKLVDHVLRYIPFSYSVIVDAEQPKTNTRFSYRSKAERIRLDALIRGSILHILRENADWVSHHIHQNDN
ncbi:MAG: hypothetical protein LDL41_14750 [Coleofasciculus sp. S288]|nr:hypothetical protein [Coleofasciculus sp. S288]